jgi:carbonic anhydrase/acetyltransferase-like protein (isoleucine patch superfamily)
MHLLLPPAPLLLGYEGVAPTLLGPLARAAPGSALLGRVTLGAGARLGPFATLRADGHVVVAGAGLHLGAHSTVHIAHERHAATLGNGVSVGENCVIHACTLGDACVVEDGACVLDGSIVGAGAVVAAGAVVFPRSVLPAGQWCEGVPAVPVRPVGATELAALHERVREASTRAVAAAPLPAWAGRAAGFVAPTVTGQGELRMGAGASLWFGCVVDAPVHGVDLAVGANVQDNSVLRCSQRAIVIGAGSVVGHNVQLHDSQIGARVLVGMGSVLASGTVVGDDSFIAAGSTTRAGQMLEGGWLWAGRPARRLLPLDEAKRRMVRGAAEIYHHYARAFATAVGPAPD